jgi:two-component system sensor histidine kinase MtrB
VVVAGVLGAGAYWVTRGFLLDQREDAALSQTLVNARLVRDSLLVADTSVNEVLAILPSTSGSRPLIQRDGVWYARGAGVSEADLPADLRVTLAVSGSATRQRFEVRGAPYLAVGVGLVEPAVTYVEVFPLSDLDRTIRTVGASLTTAAVITAVGVALAGFFASARVLRPLADVAGTAERIASGDLGARLSQDTDPDLAPLVGSFNDMADTLEERILRDAQFASDVSHEMRSPLTSLRTAVQLMQSRLPPLDERARIAVDLVESQVARFERMVLELLEISRLDAGVSPAEAADVVVADAVASLVRSLSADRVPVTIDPAARGAVARLDVRRMERVIANLLDNAAIHGGGATEVRVERNGPWVRVIVDDAGPGIPPAERNRVFERFARGSTARHRAGSGLGLALVREHVRAMGGSVAAMSSPAGGARLVVELPILVGTGPR